MAKILVVDDEQKIREVIRKYAEVSGHEVTEAGDGMSAVGLCKLNDFDLIIMDIIMPKHVDFESLLNIQNHLSDIFMGRIRADDMSVRRAEIGRASCRERV